jgi:hypothetical protein
VFVQFGVFIMAAGDGQARYAGARTLAFGGDEKIASERGSHQPRSPSQAEGMVALVREKRKKFGELGRFSCHKVHKVTKKNEKCA